MTHKPNEWHNVLTQTDIDDLFEAYGGFHDSCIVSVNYISGTYIDCEKAMCFGKYHEYRLSMVFHSQWSDYALELRFAGLRKLHLVGVQDNYVNNIFDVSLKFYDDLLPSRYQMPARVIVWADRDDFDLKETASAGTEPDDTYVIACSLEWRLTEK